MSGNGRTELSAEFHDLVDSITRTSSTIRDPSARGILARSAVARGHFANISHTPGATSRSARGGRPKRSRSDRGPPQRRAAGSRASARGPAASGSAGGGVWGSGGRRSRRDDRAWLAIAGSRDGPPRTTGRRAIAVRMSPGRQRQDCRWAPTREPAGRDMASGKSWPGARAGRDRVDCGARSSSRAAGLSSSRTSPVSSMGDHARVTGPRRGSPSSPPKQGRRPGHRVRPLRRHRGRPLSGSSPRGRGVPDGLPSPRRSRRDHPPGSERHGSTAAPSRASPPTGARTP